MKSGTHQRFDSFRIRMKADLEREKALDEAMKLLNETEYFTSDDAIEYEKSVDKKKILNNIRRTADTGSEDHAKLDTIIDLLEKANISSEDARLIRHRKMIGYASFLIVLGIAIIVTALLIIITDPDGFKGPTLIYFTPVDGMTLSDLVALLMIGAGAFCLIASYALLQRK